MIGGAVVGALVIGVYRIPVSGFLGWTEGNMHAPWPSLNHLDEKSWKFDSLDGGDVDAYSHVYIIPFANGISKYFLKQTLSQTTSPSPTTTDCWGVAQEHTLDSVHL